MTFRQRRNRVLNELASYTPPIDPQPPQAEQQPQIRQPEPVHANSEKGGRSYGIVAGVMSILLLAGVWLFWWTSEPDPTAEDPNPTIADSTSPSSPTPRPSVSEVQDAGASQADTDPIRAFLTANDWSSESRTRLLQQWQGLSPDVQKSVKSTTWFLSFSTELHTMIKEERGLAGDQPSAVVDSLVAFAAGLGLDFSLDPREPASLAPVPSPPRETEPEKEPSEPAVAAPEHVATPPATEPVEPEEETLIEEPDIAQEPESRSDTKPSGQADDKPSAVQPRPAAEALPGVEPGEKTPVRPVVTPSAQQSTRQENCRPVIRRSIIPKCRDRLKNGAKGPWLQLLPGGRYTMGQKQLEFASPAHRVSIAYPFAITTYEVSFGEFALFCRETDSVCPSQPWQDPDLPVVNVSQAQAKAYAQWLSMQSGRGYRLPTEAEWEYAARAGTTTAYPVPARDLGTYAHYSRHARETSPLPPKPQRTNPNKFGLFNMAGNVREWVLDSWLDHYEGVPLDGSPQQDERVAFGVVRGGSYADAEGPLQSSARTKLPKETQDVYTGFRLVRDIYLKSTRRDLPRWGDWWLSFQPDKLFTIRLTTFTGLDEARSLSEKHPKLALKVVSAKQPDVGYLLLSGLFDSEAAAGKAYQALPENLRQLGSGLVVKSIRELR
jgi:formylglycine-generating enzyme required for sulfatase activity